MDAVAMYSLDSGTNVGHKIPECPHIPVSGSLFEGNKMKPRDERLSDKFSSHVCNMANLVQVKKDGIFPCLPYLVDVDGIINTPQRFHHRASRIALFFSVRAVDLRQLQLLPR